MNIKLQILDNQLAFYRETKKEVILNILLSTGCISMGLIFIYLSNFELLVSVISSSFLIFGIVILVQLPRYYKRMKIEGGVTFFKADQSGLTINIIHNRDPVFYKWEDIVKIVFAKKLIDKNSFETTYLKNQLVVLINPGSHGDYHVIEKAKLRVAKSPKGLICHFRGYPKNKLEIIIKALRSLSGDTVEIESFEKVIFDFIQKEEVYISN